MLDFGKIVLSMKDERILEALVRFDVAKINSFDSAHLLELGLIAKFKPEEYDDVYYITEKGKLYLMPLISTVDSSLVWAVMVGSNAGKVFLLVMGKTSFENIRYLFCFNCVE